jgi:hypothetical protein
MKATATKAQLENGFVAACTFGRISIVEFLLQQDIDIAAQGRFGQTGLHGAAIGGQLDIIKLLLERRAPLEVTNEYGGTVLGQTLYSAAHGGDPELYVAVLELLIASGATVPERHPPVNGRVDEVLRRYGSEPENSWYWYGEKPRRARS